MTDTLLWTLVALQIAMGAFDTLYHHEFTERLAWRPTAAKELKLHSVRNVIYGGIFLTLAWSEPHGLLALLLLTVLIFEIAITLYDFVEEDLTRRLPATERVTHTLLALNYGAMLVLLLPRLWDWSQMPTRLLPTSYGILSLGLTLAAVGVVLFGLRDWLASTRAHHLVQAPAAPLVAALGASKRILVVGATGFIGERLVEALADAGHHVTAHVRSSAKSSKLRAPVTLVTRLDQIASHTRIDAIVNLAGAPVADAPWTRRNRFRILHSRIKTTRAVLRLIRRLETRPGALIAASAIGWYGPCGDDLLDERAPAGNGFAALVCRTAESEALRAAAIGVRVVTLRIGLVLDHSGGMLARMLPAFDLCAGGRLGSGHQWMSWISRDDLVRLVAHAMSTPSLEGAVNAVAPAPVRNRDFTRALGAVLGRPTILPVPAWPLRLALGPVADELILASQRVVPAKALASGFRFQRATIEAALAAAVGAAPVMKSFNLGNAAAPPRPASLT